MGLEVADAPERSRYEADADGELAGFAHYVISNRFITFDHTEVLPAFEGKGVASTLVREALRDARRRELQIIPVCPYVRRWITEHPGWDAGL
jgi:predicted GNAT family acetyltransferase